MSNLLDNPERLKRLVRLEYEQGIASADLAQRSLHEFTKQAWPHVDPSPFIDGWCIQAMCEHLQAVTDGQIKRLLINIAPRHTKSVTVSVMWPMWTWLRDSSLRWLCASYALSLALRDNLKCRRLVQSPWYHSRWGKFFQLAGDQKQKGRFETSRGGYRLAVSVGSAATGEGGDALLIDDMHSIDEKGSDVIRESALDWFDTTWSSRLNNQHTGFMVVVGQRIHSHDISGHLLELGGWEHLNLPEQFEPARKCHTCIWEDPRKEEGELLWPERFSQEILADLKHKMGAMGFAALYQQSPVPAGGAVFKQSWLRYSSETPEAYLLESATGTRAILKSSCWRFATVDLAISSKQTADYTVFAVWDVTPAHDLILVDLIRGHFDNPEQMKQLRILYQRYQPNYFRIERVGYQLALIQSALAEGIPCREYTPTRDKVSRASTAAVWMENEKLFFLKSLAELPTIEAELLQFPRGSHDDIVDTTSMAADEVVLPRTPLSGDDTPTSSEALLKAQIAERRAKLARIQETAA